MLNTAEVGIPLAAINRELIVLSLPISVYQVMIPVLIPQIPLFIKDKKGSHPLCHLQRQTVLSQPSQIPVSVFHPSILPYLMEFHISTPITLFRLWQRRQKDLPLDELSDLIQNLYTTGITSYSIAQLH